MTKNSLLRSLLNVSSMTLISRILGFLRDMLMARYFGAGVATDAFNVAFKLPNLLRRTFAEGAFSQAFVPVLAEYKTRRTHEETKQFVASVAGLLGLSLFILTILGIIFAGFVVLITAGGFSNNTYKFDLTVQLLRITFPYILFISLSSLVGSILNTWGKFTVAAFTPTFLNISFIISILFFRHYFEPSIISQAWALFVGGIMQLVFQLPFLRSIDMLVMPKLDLKNKAVWRVIKLMGPAIFAVSIAQVSQVINTIFASFLQSGSISWMYYADRIMEFPTGLLGAALGTILLPSLSKHASTGNIKSFSHSLDWGIRLCLLLALPASVGLALTAKELTMTLFMHGKFNLFDVIMTERALIAYSVGLLGLILVKVLAPGFFANQDIKTPVKIAIFALICTQLMNLAFIGPLKHAGLSLSIGLGACINATLLAYFLIRRGIYQPGIGWISFVTRLLIAIIIMSIAIKCGLIYLPLSFNGDTWIRVASLIVILLIAMVSYFIGLFMLGFRVRDFAHNV